MRYSALLDTLQNLINFKPTQEQLGKILGLPQNTISGRKSRDSEFKTEEIEKIEKHYAIKILGNNNADCVEVDYYPDVFASCGTGLMVFEESKEKITVPKDIIDNYSKGAKYSVISARGSSMAPRILDEDKLVIQHDVTQIIDDNVYLFTYNDELFIKRLVKNIDQVVCISENPRFEDRVIIPTADNFKIVGKVVGLFRNKV